MGRDLFGDWLKCATRARAAATRAGAGDPGSVFGAEAVSDAEQRLQVLEALGVVSAEVAKFARLAWQNTDEGDVVYWVVLVRGLHDACERAGVDQVRAWVDAGRPASAVW